MSGHWHAKLRQPKHRRQQDREGHDCKRDRPSREKALAQHQQRQRDKANGKHRNLHVPKLPDEQVDALEKIVAATAHAEQAGQLRHRNRKSRADFEADQYAVADQRHEDTQPEQPCKQAKSRHCESRQTRDLRVTLRIAFRHCAHARRNHE